MVKSRRANKASCSPAPPQSPPPPHGVVQRLGSAAEFVTPQEVSALQPPPGRDPNFQRVRDELGKLTRLGSVLNYSDEQSSNNGEDEDGQPATSLISPLPPDPAHISSRLEASACSSATALDRATHLKATLRTSASAADAALAFQRWRISSLKALFTQELKTVLKEAQQDEARLLALEEEMEKKEKNLVHALADSAQLRAQLCALETVNGQHQGSSDVDVLQVNLVRALERATSSEAEVERYNKEIRKLRERLKSMEDEASRLDSELNANISFLQKEKDGIAKENQVLLEQLARKDEQVLSQTEEINNFKSVLACLRVSRLELERLKSELQGKAAQQMKFAMGNMVLQSQAVLNYHPPKASVGKMEGKVEEESWPSSLVFSQVLDLLQKLTACLQKNEAHLDFLPKAKLSSEERGIVQPDLPHTGERCADEAANCKPSTCLGQLSCSRQLVNDGHPEPALSPVCDKKVHKLFTVICWKWRWVAAASEVQALSKRLNTLASISKVSLQHLFPASCLENLNQEDVRNTEHPHPDVDLPAPVTLEKVFSLFTSMWNVSSQSAHQQKEAFVKKRQIDRLLQVMARWMQRALKKRRLERVIAHWLRYLLQSWKKKVRHPNANVLLGMAPTPTPALNTRLHVSKLTAAPHLNQSSCHNQSKHLVDNAVRIKRSTNHTIARGSGIRTTSMKAGPQKPKNDLGSSQAKDLETFQECLHHKLVALEALIVKEAHSWHQQHHQSGDKLPCAHKSTAPPNLVWKICCELEHCFFEARNQIMSFFGVWNNPPPCLRAESGNMNPKIAPASSKRSRGVRKEGLLRSSMPTHLATVARDSH